MTPSTPEELAALVLPGGPGWIRRCSPVVALDDAGNADRRVEGIAYRLLPGDGVAFVACGEVYAWFRRQVALDLTNATGRAHAAWWARSHLDENGGSYNGDDVAAMKAARRGAFMTVDQIRTLRDLCLRLAGVTS